MSRITILVTATFAMLAFTGPAASAMPSRDKSGTTASPQQDLRGADARDASIQPQTGAVTLSQDLRSVDARDAATKPAEPVPARPARPARPVNPKPIAPAPVETTPVADDDTTPLRYILPLIALSLLLAAGLGYAVRTLGRARRARISA